MAVAEATLAEARALEEETTEAAKAAPKD